MRNFLKGAVVTAFVAVTAIVPSVASAFSQEEYTGNGQPEFNTYTNVPNIGDESDFLRVGIPGTGSANFSNALNACSGDVKFTVYIHNGAPEEFNGQNNTGTGVARNTRLRIQLPSNTNTSTTAVISAGNAASVTDAATINCAGKNVKVEYVRDSATIVNENGLSRKLSEEVFGSAGAPIGFDQENGVVPGCWEFRLYASFVVRLTEVPTPPVTPPTPETPTPPQSPQRPTQPTTLPKTGAADVAGLVAAATAAGTLAHRYIYGRRYNG